MTTASEHRPIIMDTSTFLALALSCAPLVHPGTAHALVATESAFNPWAIGVVGGALVRQPRNQAEALATMNSLQTQGWNYSVGLAQINQRNFERLGLTPLTVLQPCVNLQAMQTLLSECYSRTSPAIPPQAALRQALSCYYSGNFVTGFRHGYVRRVTRVALTEPPMPARSTGDTNSRAPP